MSTMNFGNIGSFIAGEALKSFCVVKLKSTSERTVEYADAGESGDMIGVTLEAAADGADVPVLLWGSSTSVKMRASSAVTSFAVNDLVILANDGKISRYVASTTARVTIGRIMEIPTAEEAVVQVYPLPLTSRGL